jgi:hypothetical protein
MWGKGARAALPWKGAGATRGGAWARSAYACAAGRQTAPGATDTRADGMRAVRARVGRLRRAGRPLRASVCCGSVADGVCAGRVRIGRPREAPA